MISMTVLRRPVLRLSRLIQMHKKWGARSRATLHTPSGHPLIQLLVQVPGKGVQLLDIINCTGHMAAGGTKGALYIVG